MFVMRSGIIEGLQKETFYVPYTSRSKVANVKKLFSTEDYFYEIKIAFTNKSTQWDPLSQDHSGSSKVPDTQKGEKFLVGSQIMTLRNYQYRHSRATIYGHME